MKKDQEKPLSYEEQIKSPYWQKRRLQILQRDTNFDLVSILYKIAHESFVNGNQYIISNLLGRDKNSLIDGKSDYDTLLFSETKSVLENLAKRRMEAKDDKQ